MNPPKSPGIAALASFIWPGAGFVYCGRFGLFVAWFFGTVALAFVGFWFTLANFGRLGGGFIYLVYALIFCIRMTEIMFSYRCAEDYNRKLATGRRSMGPRGRSRGQGQRRRSSGDEIEALKSKVRDLEATQLKERIRDLESRQDNQGIGGPVDDGADGDEPKSVKGPKRSSFKDRNRKKRRR